jgi:hypothetical protein
MIKTECHAIMKDFNFAETEEEARSYLPAHLRDKKILKANFCGFNSFDAINHNDYLEDCEITYQEK